MPPPADPLADHLQAVPVRRVLALAAGVVVTVLVVIAVITTLAAATAAWSPLTGSLHLTAVGLPVVVVLYEAGRRTVLRAPAAWFLAGRPDHRVIGWTVIGVAFPALVLGAHLAVFDGVVTGPSVSLARAAHLVLASLAAGLLAGVVEELAFRGALLRILAARWGPRVAIGLTAVVFAALHHGHVSGSRDLVLVLAAMFAAGLLLGVVVVRSRSVWNAVALHAGWNTVFGGRLVAVGPSGATLEPAVIQYRLAEPAGWLAGGDASFGASPLTTASLLGAAVVVARWGGPRGRLPAAVGPREER